jgi:hypothetical protein
MSGSFRKSGIMIPNVMRSLFHAPAAWLVITTATLSIEPELSKSGMMVAGHPEAAIEREE